MTRYVWVHPTNRNMIKEFCNLIEQKLIVKNLNFFAINCEIKLIFFPKELTDFSQGIILNPESGHTPTPNTCNLSSSKQHGILYDVKPHPTFKGPHPLDKRHHVPPSPLFLEQKFLLLNLLISFIKLFIQNFKFQLKTFSKIK